jgi:hypothetical protein
MTYDVVALVKGTPSTQDFVAGLGAAGTELRARTVGDGAVTQLFDEEGYLIVNVESPLYLQVPGEVERLLGVPAGEVETPVWWFEARATTNEGGPEAARAYAGELVRRLGGRVWIAAGEASDV